MTKPVIIYVEGAPCAITLYPTENFFHAIGSSSAIEIGNFFLRFLIDGFPTFRKGEPRWTTAKLLGLLDKTFGGINTIAVTPSPTKYDYLKHFKSYHPNCLGILIYQCGVGKAKFFSGELEKHFPGVNDIVRGRVFPHDFPEEERTNNSIDFEYEDDWE
jgi:hypothetical protein